MGSYSTKQTSLQIACSTPSCFRVMSCKQVSERWGHMATPWVLSS